MSDLDRAHDKLSQAGIIEVQVEAFIDAVRKEMQLASVGRVTINRLLSYIISHYSENWPDKLDELIKHYKDQSKH